MPNTFLTRYRLVVNDLGELALDVKDIAQDTIYRFCPRPLRCLHAEEQKSVCRHLQRGNRASRKLWIMIDFSHDLQNV